jgi:hypothetical protein
MSPVLPSKQSCLSQNSNLVFFTVQECGLELVDDFGNIITVIDVLDLARIDRGRHHRTNAALSPTPGAATSASSRTEGSPKTLNCIAEVVPLRTGQPVLSETADLWVCRQLGLQCHLSLQGRIIR